MLSGSKRDNPNSACRVKCKEFDFWVAEPLDSSYTVYLPGRHVYIWADRSIKCSTALDIITCPEAVSGAFIRAYTYQPSRESAGQQRLFFNSSTSLIPGALPRSEEKWLKSVPQKGKRVTKYLSHPGVRDDNLFWGISPRWTQSLDLNITFMILPKNEHLLPFSRH